MQSASVLDIPRLHHEISKTVTRSKHVYQDQTLEANVEADDPVPRSRLTEILLNDFENVRRRKQQADSGVVATSPVRFLWDPAIDISEGIEKHPVEGIRESEVSTGDDQFEIILPLRQRRRRRAGQCCSLRSVCLIDGAQCLEDGYCAYSLATLSQWAAPAAITPIRAVGTQCTPATISRGTARTPQVERGYHGGRIALNFTQMIQVSFTIDITTENNVLGVGPDVSRSILHSEDT
jgi:hypothetical protein